MGARSRGMQVLSLKNQRLIADKCIVAECFWDRLMGLMGRSELGDGEAMFFPRCNNLHTMFMRFPIDVVFLKPVAHSSGGFKNYFNVVSIRRNVRPWRLLPVLDFQASDALELAEGSIDANAIEVGDEVCIS